MALCADDVQPSQIGDPLPEEDVDTAAGHVRRQRHGPALTGIRDDQRLALVVLGVEDLVLDPVPAQLVRKTLALLDARRADEHRLPGRVALLDLGDDGVPLALLRLVDEVGIVLPDHRLVRWDLRDLELVHLVELLGLSRRGTGHAGELRVHAEVVLDRDRREGPRLSLDLEVFLRLDGLVEAVAPAPTGHKPPGELVDDDHLTVLDDVLLVLVVEGLRLHRVVEVVHGGDVTLVHVLHPQELLRAPDALFGEHDRVELLLDDVVGLRLQLGSHACERVVRLRRVLGRGADDERRASLVDEDRVGLVDDPVVQTAALDLVVQVHGHVVAQVVEAEFAVLAIGDVGLVGLATADVAPMPVTRIDRLELHGRVVDRALLVRDVCDGRAERVVDGGHPARTGLGEVVVCRDEVGALPLKRVRVEREGGHERLAFSCSHLGDVAFVERETTHELDIEMALLERPLRGLTDGRKDLGKDVVEGFALGQAVAEDRGAPRELRVATLFDLRLELVDAHGDLAKLAKLAFVRVEQPADEAHGTASCDR